MGAWACALALAGLLAAAETPPPLLDSRVTEVERALARSPLLLRHHRGYLACLAARPDLAEAEAAYWRLAGVPDSWSLLVACEDALDRSEEARAAFDRFHDALAEKGNLITAFEAAAGPAMPRGAATELRDLPGLFGEDGLAPDTAGEGLGTLLRLLQGAAGRTGTGATGAGTAWQAQLTALDARSGGAFGRLAAHFLEHPPDFQAWHRRNLALARHAEVRPWVRWWHARMRENDRLRGAYPAYAAELIENADAARNAEAAWRARFGVAPHWPPAGNPPSVHRVEPESNAGASPGKPAPPRMRAPQCPGRPAVPMPEMPRMPERPVKPPRP
jgi:hypothetical protein